MPNEKELVIAARELRKEMTSQERHLWYDFLRLYPVRVYRQRVIGRFIVDFYCRKAKLVIEVDGLHHYTQDAILRDAERTQILNAQGIKVIRFTNEEIDMCFDSVCKAIDSEIRNICSPPPAP